MRITLSCQKVRSVVGFIINKSWNMSYQRRKYPNLAVPRTNWQFTVEEPEVTLNLGDFVKKRVTWFKDTDLKDTLTANQLKLNGELVQDESAALKKGDSIEINKPPNDTFDPSTIPLEYLYVDDQIICINKQPGLLVQPAGTEQLNNLLSALHSRYRNMEDESLDIVPHLANRIDKYTSGIIIVALSLALKNSLMQQFENRKVSKEYLALVIGTMKEKKGVIEGAIHKDSEFEYPKFFVHSDGRPASTEYEVQEEYGCVSLVKFKPITGRTHQIRVHAAEIGHPLLCDGIYGGPRDILSFLKENNVEWKGGSQILNRCALHSSKTTFFHPIKKENLTVSAPLPEDMTTLIEFLRKEQPEKRKKLNTEDDENKKDCI